MRRKIFLQICRFKVMVENIKTNIKNLTKRGADRTKTVQGLDFSLQNDRPRRATVNHNASEIDSPNFSVMSEDMNNLTVPIDRTDKNDKLLSGGNFRFLQKGNLTLPLVQGDLCIPVEADDHLSIISYVLMTKEYHENILF